MQSLFWCRKPTSQYAPANYPVSCSAVLDRECKFAEGRGFLSPRYRAPIQSIAPIQSTYEKEATGMENPKMQSLFWCRKPTSQYAPANYPVSCSALWDGQCKFAESRDFITPRYRVCTNPIYIWKGSYGNGEPKIAILVLVQKAHLAVRACKLPGFMQRLMGRSVQICGKSGLYYAEVPCLHQSNLHMEGKLREWRTQKCDPCFGSESAPRSAGQ